MAGRGQGPATFLGPIELLWPTGCPRFCLRLGGRGATFAKERTELAEGDSVAVPDLVDRLAEHKTLGVAPREELAWLAAHGSIRQLSEGETLTAKGTQVEGLFVVLAGHIALFIDRGAGRHRVIDWRGGDVAGLLPYSRLITSPGESIAQTTSEILAVPRDALPAMIRECHEITSILVHNMLDRSRVFTSSDLQDEKMVSLGKLSAGLAHELNNPASAIERSAALLGSRLEEADRATGALGVLGLTESQLAAIEAVRASCFTPRGDGVLSPIQQAEREDEIAGWLDAHGVDAAVAGALAETGVTLDALERV